HQPRIGREPRILGDHSRLVEPEKTDDQDDLQRQHECAADYRQGVNPGRKSVGRARHGRRGAHVRVAAGVNLVVNALEEVGGIWAESLAEEEAGAQIQEEISPKASVHNAEHQEPVVHAHHEVVLWSAGEAPTTALSAALSSGWSSVKRPGIGEILYS